MASIYQGVKSTTILARQTGLGAGATSATAKQKLRVVSSTMNLQKETYQSNEIRPDQQVADFRHGAVQTSGTISAEISPKANQLFLSDVVRKEFAAVSGASLTTLAIASQSVSSGIATITGTTTSFLTLLRVGMVCSFSAGTGVHATNLNNRFVILSVTNTVITAKAIGGTDLVANAGAATGATIAVHGMVTFVPETGHTNHYYCLEKFYTDDAVRISELYTDVRPTNAQVKIQSNGMATVDFPLIGLGMNKTVPTTNTDYQITSPAATPTYGIEAGANGVIVVNGVISGIVTGIDFDINGNVTAADGVVGSVNRPDVFRGKIGVTGTITAHFDTVGALAMQNAFINETAITIIVVLSAENTPTTDFVSFTMPRVKLGGADVDFTEGGMKRTFPFTAIKNEVATATSGLELTTIMIQDSQAITVV